MSVPPRIAPSCVSRNSADGRCSLRVPAPVPQGVRALALRLLPVATLLTILLGISPAFAQKDAAIVVDARTGAVLYQDDPDGIRHPASLTKMMTLYLAFEALGRGELSLDQPLPVSSYATTMPPTKLGLRAGQTLRVEQAILALVTKSANDAAVVLAEAMGGSEQRFAQLMTHKARTLGMTRTLFRNASGLPDDEQVTTARDLATLSRALIQDHPKYYPYFSRRTFSYGARNLANHNRLMSRYDGMDGIKTGYIRASGFNLAASAVRGGRRLVAVVIGGRTAVSRDNRMAALLDAAFNQDGGTVPVASRPPVPAPSAPVPAALPALRTASASVVPDRKPSAAPRSIGQLAAAVTRAEPPDTEWGVQVGAFRSKASGQQALVTASKSVPKHLSGAQSSLTEVPTRKGTVYRARFVGMAEQQAREVCSALQRKGQRCIPVSPSEGT